MPNVSKSILGVDASSTKTGLHKVVDGETTYLDVWARDDKKSLSENLLNYGEFLEGLFPVDVVVLERLSVNINLDTVRKICYYEGVTILIAQKWKAKLVHLSPGEARKSAFGKGFGNKGKEWYYKEHLKEYDLLPFKKGGGDQSDSITLTEAYLNE